MNDEERILAIHKLVLETSVKCHELIIESMNELVINQKWKVYGRIINQLFANHYEVSLRIVTPKVED